ncbi:ATP synthase subunit I [Sporohalobacter salinus]|uniref:ATP synthase subunit I n=1 Tax=Sporohalobacter salinus TaxID=1494606 RepID=UPI0019603F86|nr:ATP synthase subunit I [Sporohalobacter salinus]MBM7622893.1 diacylglycerol kinase [Sporohalobacter salinus]
MQKELQQTEINIRKKTLKGAGLIIILLISSMRIDLLLGYILGTSISVLMFRLLAITIEEAVTKDIKKAQGSVFVKYLIRYFIWGIILYTALQVDHLNFLTTVLGLFMIKFTILTTTLYREAYNYLNNLVEQKD